MESINELLDRARRIAPRQTDYGLAKLLHCPTAQVTQYRKGRRIPAPNVCVQLAGVLNDDPLYVIACAETARDPDTVPLWQRAFTMRRRERLSR